MLAQVKAVMNSDYIPNFKTAFQHFLVHTGGRAVIEEVEKKLSLAPADVQPSKETLFRYGNTCCAAVFYVLTNMESRVRKDCLLGAQRSLYLLWCAVRCGCCLFLRSACACTTLAGYLFLEACSICACMCLLASSWMPGRGFHLTCPLGMRRWAPRRATRCG